MQRILSARICSTALIFITTAAVSACATAGGHHGADSTSGSAAPAVQPDGSGTWEGVHFAAEEVTAVLDYVNTATMIDLDERAAIDVRAARSIVKARPIADLDTLSELYFVGTVTLGKLKAAANEVRKLSKAVAPYV